MAILNPEEIKALKSRKFKGKNNLMKSLRIRLQEARQRLGVPWEIVLYPHFLFLNVACSM